MNNITMTLQVDHLIMEALREDISSEGRDHQCGHARSCNRRSRPDLQAGWSDRRVTGISESFRIVR